MLESKLIKSRNRVHKHGEVFTAEREVKAMCDLVKDESERIDSKFLEPACGDGNFLAEILTRKLDTAKNCKGSTRAFEIAAVTAVSSIYGIDILMDNVELCRSRLFKIWDEKYTAYCGLDANDEVREAVKFILSRNIVCGNALTTYCVDENQIDTDVPIVFSEWTFVSDDMLQRSDYTLEKLLRDEKQEDQITLGDILNEDGGFLKTYTTNYKKVQYDG